MPEQGSGDKARQPEPPPPAPQKIEIIPLEPKRVIKRSDEPLPVEKRSGGNSGR